MQSYPLSRYFNQGKNNNPVFLITPALTGLAQGSSHFCLHNPKKDLEKLCTLHHFKVNIQNFTL